MGLDQMMRCKSSFFVGNKNRKKEKINQDKKEGFLFFVS